jgi:hypothetical protein
VAARTGRYGAVARLFPHGRRRRLQPDDYQNPQLAKALGAALGGPAAKVRKADMLLSQAFVAYVRDLKRSNPPA